MTLCRNLLYVLLLPDTFLPEVVVAVKVVSINRINLFEND